MCFSCASLAPMAKCNAQFINGSRFEFWCSALIKRAEHLTKCARIWPKVAHLVKCRAFCQLVRCTAHLTRCASLSNAPYMHMINLSVDWLLVLAVGVTYTLCSVCVLDTRTVLTEPLSDSYVVTSV